MLLGTAVTPGWSELPRLNAVANPQPPSQTWSHIDGDNTATACFRRQLLPELEFAPHSLCERGAVQIGVAAHHQNFCGSQACIIR